jgi:hypothetical protein
LQRLHAAGGALDGAVQRVASDETRSEEYTAAEIGNLRAEALPELGTLVNDVAATAAVLDAQAAYYSNTALLLSLVPAHDAAGRAARLAEYTMMPHALLELTALRAKHAGDWATYYVAWLAATRSGAHIPLDNISLPQQVEALAAIERARAMVTVAQGVFAMAHGTRLSGASRLADARARATARAA